MNKLVSMMSILALAFVMTSTSISALPVMEGHKAPEFVVIGYNSNKTAYVLNSHMLRNRTVIVVFFAHYCPHCRSEMENLIKAWDLYADKSRDVMILVGVSGSAERDWDLFKANCREGWYFVPENYTLADMFKIDAVPATFVVDGSWTVQLTHIGEIGMGMLALAIQQAHRGPWTDMPVTPIEKFIKKNETKKTTEKAIKSNIPENAEKYFLIGALGAFITALAVLATRSFYRGRSREDKPAESEEIVRGGVEGSEEAQYLVEEENEQIINGNPEA